MIFFLFYGYVVNNSTTFFFCKEQKFPWLPADEKGFVNFSVKGKVHVTQNMSKHGAQNINISNSKHIRVLTNY